MEKSENRIQQLSQLSMALPLMAVFAGYLIMNSLKAVETPIAKMIPGIVVLILLGLGVLAGLISAVQWKKSGSVRVLVVSIVGIVLSGFFLVITIGSAASSLTKTVKNSPAFYVGYNSAGLPKMIDKDTRCDSVILGAENDIIQYYTMVNFEGDDLDLQYFKETMKIQLQAFCDTSAAYSIPRTTKTPVTFSYSDKEGDHFCDITLEM